MWKKLIQTMIIVPLVLALGLSACQGAPVGAISSSGGLRAWVDQPFDDVVLPLAPFTLKAHGSSEGGGITQITFLANGVPIGSVPTEAGQPLVYAESPWNPSAPGEYLIQAQAVGGGGSSISDSVRVCISSGENDTVCGPPQNLAGENPGDQPKLDITITPTTGQKPPLDAELKVGAAPDPVYVGACTKGEPQVVTFEGYAGDSSEAIEVYIDATLQGVGGSWPFMLALTASGGGGYMGTFDLTAADTSVIGDSNGSIVYTLQLMNDRKEFFATSVEKSIQVIPCIYGQQPPLVMTTVVPQQLPGGDTTPPSVKAQISANVIYYGGKGCNPTSVTVTAYVTDNVAVARANIFWYYAPGGDPYHAQTALMSGSGSNWSYTINPSQTGTIAYWVEGWDTSNNHAQSQGPNTVTVVACQGQPPPVVTTEVPQQPPPPPQDTTPPNIQVGSPSPDVIYSDPNCGPTQTTVKVSASDDSGVAAIYVNWQYSSSGGGKDDASGGSYTFPAPNKGDTSLSYWFEACDTLNNCATSKSFSVTVTDCKP